MLRLLLGSLLFAGLVFGQGATASRIRPVTALPPTCTVTAGDVVVLIVAPMGFYSCGPANNQWTYSSGVGPQGPVGPAGPSGSVGPQGPPGAPITWTTISLGSITGLTTLNVGSSWIRFTGTLTGDTTVSISGTTAASFQLDFTQDGVGGHKLICDSTFEGCGAISQDASAECWQTFTWDGTSVGSPSGGMTCQGSAPAIITSAGQYPLPSSPAKLVGWGDVSTDGSMTANSDLLVPSQKSVVTYVSSHSGGGGGGSGVGRNSFAITWGQMYDGDCQEQTATWTGVTTGNTIVFGWPSSLPAGIIANGRVSSSNTVSMRMCNLSGTTVTPGLLTTNATLAIYNLSATSAISFSTIPDGSCLQNNFTVTGVSAGDPIAPYWPAALETGLVGSMVASSSNTVTITLCNWSGASVSPAAGETFGASIAK